MGLLGSIASGATSFVGGLFGNQAAAKQARKNRDFQERMYKNRYTYTMSDLKNAGLNPKLALSGGGGLGAGPTPGGSMAAQANPAAGIGAAISAGGSAAEKGSREKAEASRIKKTVGAQLDAIKAQAGKDETQAELNIAQSGVAAAQEITQQRTQELIASQQAGQELTNKYQELGLPSAEAQSAFDKTWLGQILNTIRRGGDLLGGTLGRGGGGKPAAPRRGHRPDLDYRPVPKSKPRPQTRRKQ